MVHHCRPLCIAGVLILSCIVQTGCSSSSPSTRANRKPITDYEKDFNPSRHGTKDTTSHVNTARKRPGIAATRGDSASGAPVEELVERTEKSMGYRVQLYSSADLTEAQDHLAQLRTVLDSLSPEISFDPPVYKIRVGNCVTREEAEILKDAILQRGVSEAWIVRDQIVRVYKEKIRR